MKKIKLIRKYPSSPNLGTVITAKVDKENNNTNNFYWVGNWFNPNDYPEYWEEVVEPDYEILSFKQDSGITDLWTKFHTNTWGRNVNGQCVTKPYTTEEILSHKLYAIHSVKRLSDGEVFTVGDTIKTHKWGSDNIINSITIAEGTNSFKRGIWLNCEGGRQHFSHSIKVIQKDYEVTQVSYATEIRTLYNGQYRLYQDGVGFDLNYILKNCGTIHSVKRLSDGEVFTVGDRIGFDGRDEGKLLQIEFEIAPADKGTGKLCFVNDNWRLGKWFSINQLHKVKKHIFITHDGVNVYKSDSIWLLHKKTYTKSPYLIRNENDFTKLDLSDYICFSKKEKLNEYILKHKPFLSLDDIQRAINLPPMFWDKLLAAAKAKLNYEQDTTN